MRFDRVATLGDGAFVWSATVVVATTRTDEGELRTVHDDGAIIAWTAAGEPRVLARLGPVRTAAWVDDERVIVHHPEPSELELFAVDGQATLWRVRAPYPPLSLVVLPCKTMFYRDGRGGQSSALHSLADGSALEETSDAWVAVGRHAKYRCAVRERPGPVLRSWYDADHNYEEEVGPSTYTWRLERDGETLLEITRGEPDYPTRCWIADDDASVTVVVGARIVGRSLPDPSLPAPPTPEPSPVPRPTPATYLSLEDVPELPVRADVAGRFGVPIAADAGFVERAEVLCVAHGRDIRCFRAGSSTPFARHTVAYRGTHVSAALGGDRALVVDGSIDTWSPAPPPTRQLRVVALEPGVDEPRLLHVLDERPWKACPYGAPIAASPDGELGADAAFSDLTVRLWDLARGALVQTIDLAADEDRVRSLAFGDGHRLFVATTRGRVLTYAPVP